MNNLNTSRETHFLQPELSRFKILANDWRDYTIPFAGAHQSFYRVNGIIIFGRALIPARFQTARRNSQVLFEPFVEFNPYPYAYLIGGDPDRDCTDQLVEFLHWEFGCGR